MLDLLFLIPALPFLGFLILAILGKRLLRPLVALIGVGSVGLSAWISISLAMDAIQANSLPYTQTLWTWISINGFNPSVSFYLDRVSLVMILVITFVGFLIHLYSAGFMKGDEGYSRFFAYMNLFVGSMLTLVLADNLLFLYLGWEGVGLCSYLLIGFWYRDEANGKAAIKAFIVTRIGDAAMAIGLFLLFLNLETLNIQQLMARAAQQWPVNSGVAIAAAALLLGGALGKSAQLPLQTWLPDAMAGPTPVSALIHAATMVTAGVYLIARTHVLFMLAPPVQTAVAVIGAVTLLVAAFSAMTQYDIKRVLAYSTISQIGYMFLALGVGAWSAAIFHFMTHAFFKALLFLGAGVVIIAMHEEHDMFKMGGLRKKLPLTFWTFLIGACSLAALPFVTAGFYSKDLILFQAWSSDKGSGWLWAGGLVGAFLTAFYAFRMVFVTFFGRAKKQLSRKPGLSMLIPLIVLAFLSLVGGFIAVPEFLRNSMPAPVVSGSEREALFQVIAGAVSLLGIVLAYIFYIKHPDYVETWERRPAGMVLYKFWHSGWGFDWIYDRLFVRPFLRIAKINKNDFIDSVYTGAAWVNEQMHYVLSRTQSGNVGWYVAGIGFGAVIVIGIVIVAGWL